MLNSCGVVLQNAAKLVTVRGYGGSQARVCNVQRFVACACPPQPGIHEDGERYRRREFRTHPASTVLVASLGICHLQSERSFVRGVFLSTPSQILRQSTPTVETVCGEFVCCRPTKNLSWRCSLQVSVQTRIATSVALLTAPCFGDPAQHGSPRTYAVPCNLVLDRYLYTEYLFI